jgi:hypothetical protein
LRATAPAFNSNRQNPEHDKPAEMSDHGNKRGENGQAINKVDGYVDMVNHWETHLEKYWFLKEATAFSLLPIVEYNGLYKRQ